MELEFRLEAKELLNAVEEIAKEQFGISFDYSEEQDLLIKGTVLDFWNDPDAAVCETFNVFRLFGFDDIDRLSMLMSLGIMSEEELKKTASDVVSHYTKGLTDHIKELTGIDGKAVVRTVKFTTPDYPNETPLETMLMLNMSEEFDDGAVILSTKISWMPSK